jgi:phosphatidylserine/phosphatidylglycerophosphate/cardiolipin synthase-like enzyme
MRLTHTVFVNADDALIVWIADELDTDLRGFALQRRRNGNDAEYLSSFTPFGPEAHKDGQFQRSDERPFRCFSWTDHDVEPGDTVSYRVVPMYEKSGPRPSRASRWSARRVADGADPRSPYRAYFNRGYVISQFVSRYLDETYPGMPRASALSLFKRSIGDATEVEWREKLSGQLRRALLQLLDEVIAGRDQLYAALYELDDEELIGRLTRLGARAHVVLSNGSVKVERRDQNSDARKTLIRAGVETLPRFLSPGGLGHNKFVVVTDAAGTPQRVWTGSTNWTPTGLCTQINNGVRIEDAAIAARYLEQWHALANAGDGFPRELVTANGQPTSFGGTRAGRPRASVHFTKAPRRVDLTALAEIIASTQSGLLFLLFNAGTTGVIPPIQALAEAKPDVLVRGVATELPQPERPRGSRVKLPLRMTLFGDPTAPRPIPRTFDVILPVGHAHTAARWAVESTRGEFKGGVGPAIIHSKVLVVDPFSDDPTVVTGSHNFSSNASGKNDENFVVIRGDRVLAEAYAVHVQTAWRHYSARVGTAHVQARGLEYLQLLLDDVRRVQAFWGLR